MIKRKSFLRKPGRMPLKASKLPQVRRRRKKGEITRLKEVLWKICREVSAKIYEHRCYTCGVDLRWGSSVMQLGHFIPRSVCSQEIHFELKNLRWQCRICNQFKNGRWPEFEARLIREHGPEYVQYLKDRNQETKGKTVYPKEWFLSKIEEYQKMLDELSPGQNVHSA